MGREGKLIEHPFNQPIDISDWKGYDEFEIYPQGARDKSLLISPAQSEYEFLIPNHRYLFKRSFQHKSRNYPEQYWTEIIAYRIGCLMKVPVPPAFVALDSTNNVCGALIEWFLDYPDQPEERRTPGGDIMVNLISDYDRKKGRHHIRWQLNDEHQCQHVELLLQLVKKYPFLKDRITQKLELLEMEQLRSMIYDCILYKKVAVPLSKIRAKFIYHLVESRCLTIRDQINLT